MQSKGAKIIFIIVTFVVFGGAMYWMYGPNSDKSKAKQEQQEILKNYVKTEATIISKESNGKIGKGSDVIYTLQFTNDKTGQLTTATIRGRESGWFDFDSKNEGEKVVIYYDPENPNLIRTEKDYNETMS